MASTDPVEIVVDIIDQFSPKLAELRAQLEQIDAMNIDVNFDIEDVEREVANARAQVESIPNNEIVTFHARTRGMARVRAQVASAQSSLGAGTARPRLGGVSVEGPFGGGGGGPPGGGFDVSDATDVDFRSPGGRRGFFSRLGSRIDDPMEQAHDSMSSMGRVLRRITPNMMMLWNILAAMIPILVSLGAAAIGLVGAFGALAAAGAAIVGVGLLGWGDDFSSSMENLTSQAEDLGARLFEVMQPAAQTFQPILSDWMQGAPRQIEQLVGPMQNLTVFADALEASGAGFVDWIGEVIDSMVGMENQIEQITLRFGEIAGGFIIRFFENMINFAYENQNALIRLSASLAVLLGALLDISMAVTAVVATFSPLIEAVGLLASLFDTQLGVTILTIITSLFLLETAAGAVLGIMALLGSGGAIAAVGGALSGLLPTLTAITIAVWEMYGAIGAVGMALTALTGGLLLIGGGLAAWGMAGEMTGGPPGGGGGGGGTGGGSGTGNTYVQIDGDVGQREYDRLIDKTHGTTREEMSIQEDMNE